MSAGLAKNTFKPVKALPFRKYPFGHSGARFIAESASFKALERIIKIN